MSSTEAVVAVVLGGGFLALAAWGFWLMARAPRRDEASAAQCAHEGCVGQRDPRCAGGHCGKHCGLYCPRGCREGTDAEARAKALLLRYGPLEKEKTE